MLLCVGFRWFSCLLLLLTWQFLRSFCYLGWFSDTTSYRNPWHIAGVFLNLCGLIVTIQDLYARPSLNPNSKITWCLLITWTGGIGWFVYVFKYAIHAREPNSEMENLQMLESVKTSESGS